MTILHDWLPYQKRLVVDVVKIPTVHQAENPNHLGGDL